MWDVKKISSYARNSILYSYLAVAIGLVVVAFVLFTGTPAQTSENDFFTRSEFFFFRLIWAEVLIALLFFGGLLIPFFKNVENSKHIGGGYLVISHQITLSTVISLVILLATIFIPTAAYKITYLKFHIAIQIIIAVVMVLKISMVYFSMAMHSYGLEPLPGDIKKPSDLVLMLKYSEMDGNLNSIQKKRVKKIREWIKYSVPQNGKVAMLPEYRQLVKEIEIFTVSMVNNDFTEFDKAANSIEKNINDIVSKLRI